MNKNNKPLTLKKVAEILSCSTATISNAFNRPDQLSASLRERILTECKRIGYHGPNITARTLRKGESGVIGVLLSDALTYHFTDPVANQFLQGISEILEQNNKQLLLLSSATGEKTSTGIESLPDGFIVYGNQENSRLFERVVQQGKSMVTVDFDSSDYASINIDNFQAAYDIGNHVFVSEPMQPAILGLKLIHSDRVCRITKAELLQESQSISRRRLNGYLSAAKANNVEISCNRIWHIPENDYQLAYQAAHEALTSLPMPDALICMSDIIAIAAMAVARELKLDVPDIVKIVGFDDIPEAARVSPPLTTVCQRNKEKGKVAAEKLLAGELSQNTILPSQLVVRLSS
ncbi:LacI family transcriptional regulator [Catenovulum agarivorans DS-2]|uniref:LacI family transcriptional regulator n=1 Tax=Catenovulum agarivorans DS-2 TaxID=1328313 RepID=W7QP48_9ALTE|nr:LacI family DNA-binding transcriptional regulator [Catenovulum agarivorans]EWH10752.1 LacI family transcriptional regulator [Catenovulum agarivorans DS-2]